jgi:hypothetical protein
VTGTGTTGSFLVKMMISNCRFRSRKAGRCTMKGYTTESGYMGYVEGRYLLFSSENDYIEYMDTEEM